jgi:hypothetical protein
MSNSTMFALTGRAGDAFAFPTGRYALLTFLGEDDASQLSLPLAQAAHDAFGESVDIWSIATRVQPMAPGGCAMPQLADPGGEAFAAFEVGVVPTVILAGRDGEERERFSGFDRSEWQLMFERLISRALSPAPVIDWAKLPAHVDGVSVG